MAKYNGSIELISGIKPAGDFPIAEAKDIQVDDEGTRLSTALKKLAITPYTKEEYNAAKEAGLIEDDQFYVVYDPTETESS